MTLTAPPRANAAIHAFAPPPTAQRGRPRVKGARLGSPRELAAAPAGKWRQVSVPGRGEAMLLVVHALWLLGLRLARDPAGTGPRARRQTELPDRVDLDRCRGPSRRAGRALSGSLVDRGLLPARKACSRDRRSSQPSAAGGRADRALRPVLPDNHRRLVRPSRRPHRRRSAPPPHRPPLPRQARSHDARRTRQPTPRTDQAGISGRNPSARQRTTNQTARIGRAQGRSEVTKVESEPIQRARRGFMQQPPRKGGATAGDGFPSASSKAAVSSRRNESAL